MHGLMQHHELLISSVLEHAARHHGDGEVVSRRSDGALARTNYAALGLRARKLVSVLRGLDVAPGDRVGTLAMNSDRHLELYYGISGSGALSLVRYFAGSAANLVRQPAEQKWKVSP